MRGAGCAQRESSRARKLPDGCRDLFRLAFQSGKGLRAFFEIFRQRLRFEELGQAAGLGCSKNSQGAEQGMRGAGGVRRTLAGDGVADIRQEGRGVLVEEPDNSLHQDFVAVEIVE